MPNCIADAHIDTSVTSAVIAETVVTDAHTESETLRNEDVVVENLLPVTVLSGFLGGGKTTLLKRILEQREGLRVAVIVNDLSEINIDAQLIASNKSSVNHVEEKLVEMSNGCICCTLRKDLIIEVRKMALEKKFDYLLIESTGVAETMPIAEAFALEYPGMEPLKTIANLDTMVTIVDCSTFRNHVKCSKSLAEVFDGVPDEDERSLCHLLIDQVECATVIILNKIDKVSEGERLKVESAVRALNPDATIICSTFCDVPLTSILNTKSFDFTKVSLMPGWLQQLRTGEWKKAETDVYGIDRFVYARRRPFHPERLFAVLRDKIMKYEDKILRGKGFFWLATRNDCYGDWEQVGSMISMDYGGEWYAVQPKETWAFQKPLAVAHIQRTFTDDPLVGDRRQELVFIGCDLPRQEVEDVLDTALLTDSEWELGCAAWKLWNDPIESWEDDSEDEEDEEDEEEEDEDDDEDEEEKETVKSSHHLCEHAHNKSSCVSNAKADNTQK